MTVCYSFVVVEVLGVVQLSVLVRRRFVKLHVDHLELVLVILDPTLL